MRSRFVGASIGVLSKKTSTKLMDVIMSVRQVKGNYYVFSPTIATLLCDFYDKDDDSGEVFNKQSMIISTGSVLHNETAKRFFNVFGSLQ